MSVPFTDGIHLEIFVMDLIKALEPKDAEELQDISEELHQHIEIAIQDQCEEYEYWKEYEPMM